MQLKKIEICQGAKCKNKGSAMLHNILLTLKDQYKDKYPNLEIEYCDCLGACEEGPIVRLNEEILVRRVTGAMLKEILEDPDKLIAEEKQKSEIKKKRLEKLVNGELFLNDVTDELNKEREKEAAKKKQLKAGSK